MICNKCGNDRFDTINVWRGKRRKEGKWIINHDYDTRLIICNDCGQRYYSETVIVSEIIFDKSSNKVMERTKDGKIYRRD